MAVIDPKKLLPPAKKSENSEKFLVPISSIVLKKNVAISSKLLKPEEQKEDGKGGAIVPSKLVDKIIKVESILKSNLVSQISQQNKKEKEEKRKEAEEREKKLEIKPENKGKVPLPSLPRIGFLDALRNYFINTLLGFIAAKLFDMAPKLIKFLDAIKPVAGFIGEFAGNLFNGLIEFVDKGYKAYDEVQKFVKSVGGENAEKLFNDFSKNLSLLLNGAIIAATVAISTAPKGPKGGGRGGLGVGGTPKPTRTPTGYRTPEGMTRFLREDRIAQFGSRQKGFGERLSQRQRIAQQKLVQRPLRNLTRPARQLSGKVLNTGAAKLAGKAFGRIPIIGGLIDFAFNLAMGEKPGRAAAKAVGSTLGAALGTFIPIPFAGTILGGILGDLVGGALYDTLVGSKPQKVQGKAQGGVVSSGRGKTPPRRGIKVQRAKPRRIVTQRTQPGKDIGGVKKIEELYGEDQPGTRSALRALKKSSEDVKRMRSLNGLSGAMFGAGIDMALGQKPDKNLSASLGSMFGAVIQTAIDSELNNTFGDITKTIAMAGGGVVPSRELKSNMSIGERIGRYISSALAVSIESSASKILQNLNKELRLEGGPAGNGGGGDGGDGGTAGGEYGGYAPTGIQKEIYEYLINVKKLSDVQALGLMANIHRESGFRPGIVSGDDGGAGGLFQWKIPRSTAMSKSVPDWKTNWKAQIDYALREPGEPGPQYISKKFTSAQEAADWWMREWERPSDKVSASEVHKKYLSSIPKAPNGTVRFREGSVSIRRDTGYKPLSPGLFNAVEYITGDSTQGSNYDEKGHGGRVYHEHIAFATIADKERAKKALRAAGFEIGSEYRSNSGTYHGLNLAIDVPLYKPSDGRVQKGYADNATGEKKFSAEVRRILGIDGGSSPPKPEPPKPKPRIQNKGVVFDPSTGKFVQKGGGLLGTNQEINVTNEQNIGLRESVKGFGLGTGTKEGEKKRAADGNYYEWKNGRWVLWNPAGPGANASLAPDQPESSTIATASFLNNQGDTFGDTNVVAYRQEYHYVYS